MKVDLNFKYSELIHKLNRIKPFDCDTAITLGSGLGDFANSIDIKLSVDVKDLPGYPHSTIEGHSGKIHFAAYRQKKLVLFQGRIHFYEGYDIEKCLLPIFLARKLNCKQLLLSNAAGGISNHLAPGDLMLISSLNAIGIKKELTNFIGLSSIDQHNRFIDFPDKSMIASIKSAAAEEKIALKEGVYFFTKGPSYETPAEIRMIKISGADAVGMSTAHEAVFASVLGMRVAAISCITNYAAGIRQTKLSHSEVMETADSVKEKFERLIKKSLELI